MALVSSMPASFFHSVKGIPVPVPLPPGAEEPNPEPPSEKDMGKDDLSGSDYVNATTDQIPPGHEDRVKYLQDIMLKSQKYLDVYGGVFTRKQINEGNLPDDMDNNSQMKRSDYRIKVYSTLIGNSSMGWLASSAGEIVDKKFDVERSEFHFTLMKAILEGIVGLKGMTTALENILKSITDMVEKTGHYSEKHHLWSFFNICKWDEQAQDVKAALRYVNFQVSADIVEVTTNKSSTQRVNMSLTYFQTEMSVIESEWDYYKPKVINFLHDMGDKSIRDPTDGGEIPVDD